MEKENPPNKLILPEGVASTGPVENVTEAYVNAVVALPEILSVLIDEIREIGNGLSILSLYCERKGLAEHVFSEDDIEGDDDEMEEIRDFLRTKGYSPNVEGMKKFILDAMGAKGGPVPD